MIYFDNNATTQPFPEVIQAVTEALTSSWLNPSARYPSARIVEEKIELARLQLAHFLGTSANRILFTSGGTESTNTVFHSLLSEVSTPTILALSTDHSATKNTLLQLEKAGKIKLRLCPVNSSGLPDLSDWEKLCQGANLATFAWANNETGVLPPGQEMLNIAHETGCLTHADMVQIAGKIPLKLDDITHLNYASFSAHKFHGPKGIGALWSSPSAPLHCFICGGSQENFLRAGTQNVESIIGMGIAADICQKLLPEGISAELRDLFETRLNEISNISFQGKSAPRLPQTSSVTFRNCPAEGLLLLLDQAEICCSAGSACQSGSPTPSHVLSAMGLSNNDARSTLRFSFSHMTTKEEIISSTEIISRAVAKIRSVQSSQVGSVIVYSPKNHAN